MINKKKEIHIHGKNIEEQALDQFSKCCEHDFVIAAALMPDAHTGYVAPIGSVIKTNDAVVPSWVGYDIGCGMIAINISNAKEDLELIKIKAQELFDDVNLNIPMGVGGYNNKSLSEYSELQLRNLLNELAGTTSLRDVFDMVQEKCYPNLGTLGSGNHFIEILEYQDESWLVIHSGSRGVGYYIAEYFMKAASNLDKNYEDTFIVTGKLKDEYINYQYFCLRFALLNRLTMAMKVEDSIKRITGINYTTSYNLWTNKNHNYCDMLDNGHFLHRKGATSSELGEKGVIPANMRDGCYLVEGLGNNEFLNSSSHGAGRNLSRGRAKKEITLMQFQEQMKGITAPVCTATIDESPMAYKNIEDVMELQKDSVKILKHLKPIINWKGFKK